MKSAIKKASKESNSEDITHKSVYSHITFDEIFTDHFEELDEDSLKDEVAPDFDAWVFPPLYTRNSNDKILKWQIGYTNTEKEIIWLFGQLEEDSKIQVFRDPVTINTRFKTENEKAFSEAKTKIENKIKVGYSFDPEDINLQDIASSGFPSPMLANLLKEPCVDTKTGKVTKGNILSFPVVIQAKFDGVRNLARLNRKDEVIMISRKNIERKFFDHIRNELKILFNYLPKGTIIDGEFYSSSLIFQQIESIVGRTKEPHPKENEIKLYLFDIFKPGKEWTTEKRIDLLSEAFENAEKDGINFKNIVRVGNNIAHDYEDIRKYYDEAMKMKYEGAMIRQLSHGEIDPKSKIFKRSLYLNRRSDNLLKVKKFTETEYIVIDVKEGRGREKGAAILIVEDPITGKRVSVRPAETHDMRKEWYKNRHKLVGKLYRVKYFDKTVDDSLRFPTGLGFKEDPLQN